CKVRPELGNSRVRMYSCPGISRKDTKQARMPNSTPLPWGPPVIRSSSRITATITSSLRTSFALCLARYRASEWMRSTSTPTTGQHGSLKCPLHQHPGLQLLIEYLKRVPPFNIGLLFVMNGLRCFPFTWST
ncbi:hypothetical protein FOZ62_006609, partial [Perkinsus olseni]